MNHTLFVHRNYYMHMQRFCFDINQAHAYERRTIDEYLYWMIVEFLKIFERLIR